MGSMGPRWGEASDDGRIPHEVALDIIRGTSAARALRSHQGVTLAELSIRSGLSASHLSELERHRKEPVGNRSLGQRSA